MSFVSGQTDVISGLLCNGRPEDMDGEKLVGLFLNTLPVRLKLDGGAWIDLVEEAFAAEQAIIPHRRFPLVEIQKLNGSQPIFETAVDFVHSRGTTPAVAPSPTPATFAALIASLGLRHFDADEILAPTFNTNAGVANSRPPQTLWKNILPTIFVLDEIRERPPR